MPVCYCVLNAKRGTTIVPEAPTAGRSISASVGLGGANLSPDVKTVQELLNRSCAFIGVPKQSLVVDGWIGPKTTGAIRDFQLAQFGTADSRVDPNQRTIGRLNVIPALAGGPITSGGPPPVSAPPPPTPAPLKTPLQAAIESTPLATLWTLGAFNQMSILLGLATATGGVIVDPTAFATVNTHFHLDRDPLNLTGNLFKILRIFSRMQQVLMNPAKFYREGAATPKSPFADAPMGGFDAGEPFNHITFRTQYPSCGPNCRAAMIVHECAHLVGGLNEIGHFAMEFPAPNGQPQDGSAHDYASMTTAEALKNASSYAAFAIHATTGVDSRFGASDLTK